MQTKTQEIGGEPLQLEPQPASYQSPLDFNNYELSLLIERAFQLQFGQENSTEYGEVIEELKAERVAAFEILRDRYLSLDPEDAYLIPVRERILGVITHLDAEESVQFFLDVVVSPVPLEYINVNYQEHHWSNVENETALRMFAIVSLGRFIANGIAPENILQDAFISQENRVVRYGLVMQMVIQGAPRSSVLDFAMSQGADWVEGVFEQPVPIIYDDGSLVMSSDYEHDGDEQTADDLLPAPEGR